ncbi:DNA replication/repair protein RecF [Patescibacteria group bacterium]
MRLKSIKLENYRNYENLDLSFDDAKNINLFIGDNAQGKTNFLEAITLLSLAKSFRTKQHTSLIQWEKDYTRIVGTATHANNEISLEFFASIAPVQKKNLRKDNADVSIKNFIGQLNIVLFHPEDLNMLYLSPSLRRKYLDTILSQTDPLYFDALIQYNRIVKQRNKALFLIDLGKSSAEELDVWDQQLAEYGTYILKKRLKLVDFFNEVAEGNYNNVSQTKDKLGVSYNATIEGDYLEVIKAQRKNDLRYAQTTKGIHRDDLVFNFNGHNISEFGSRGEMRTLLIALKFTEIAYIEKQAGRKPILLLDDVFSELDKKRQQFLMDAIQEFQSFITTTHHDFSVDGSSVFEIESGKLK